MASLLERVASFESLEEAFHLCARGKRKSIGYQKMFSDLGDRLTVISSKLLSGSFHWSKHRRFMVHDPKALVISAPPFRDRVVHTAICREIEPLIDPLLSDSVYACRSKKGNRFAVIELIAMLRSLGNKRFVVKLDVEKYFDSVDHEVLLRKVLPLLSDNTMNLLLKSLVDNYHSPLGKAKGLPIGSLTSQLFANFYLHSADEVVLGELDEDEGYLRYMDDLVIVAKSKKKALDVADAVCQHVQDELFLKIPFQKRVPLAGGAVPFLGFYCDGRGYRILTRNERRHKKRLRRMIKQDRRESRIAMTQLSFDAFKNLEPHLQERMSVF